MFTSREVITTSVCTPDARVQATSRVDLKTTAKCIICEWIGRRLEDVLPWSSTLIWAFFQPIPDKRQLCNQSWILSLMLASFCCDSLALTVLSVPTLNRPPRKWILMSTSQVDRKTAGGCSLHRWSSPNSHVHQHPQVYLLLGCRALAQALDTSRQELLIHRRVWTNTHGKSWCKRCCRVHDLFCGHLQKLMLAKA